MDAHPAEHLTAYADGALTPEEAAEIAAHLASCASCREMLDDLVAVRELLRSIPDPLPHPAALPRTLARLQRRRIPRWLAGWAVIGAVAAAALLLLQVRVLPPLHDPGTSAWYFQQHARLSSTQPMADLTLSSYLSSGLPYGAPPQAPGIEELP